MLGGPTMLQTSAKARIVSALGRKAERDESRSEKKRGHREKRFNQQPFEWTRIAIETESAMPPKLRATKKSYKKKVRTRGEHLRRCSDNRIDKNGGTHYHHKK